MSAVQKPMGHWLAEVHLVPFVTELLHTLCLAKGATVNAPTNETFLVSDTAKC